MVVNPAKTVRKIVSLPVEMAEEIKNYWHANRISSEAKTIRQLIEMGLKVAATSEK